MTEPLVDIVLVAYNHEKFIAQAIESVLMQKTEFKYRLFIGDDCSTDNTQSIIRQYAEKYPDCIQTLLYTKNLGVLHKDRIGKKLLELCKAKYITLLDGDDYWTSPHKLQKQVDVLNANPDVAISFHDGVAVRDDGCLTKNSLVVVKQKEVFTIRDLLKGWSPHTCTVMIRHKLLTNFPEWYYESILGDWLLFVLVMLNTNNGKLMYLNEHMSVYRDHGGGIWSSLGVLQREQEILRACEELRKHLTDKEHKELLDINILRRWFNLALCYEANGETENAKVYFSKVKNVIPKYLPALINGRDIPQRELSGMILGAYAPQAHKLFKFTRMYFKSAILL